MTAKNTTTKTAEKKITADEKILSTNGTGEDDRSTVLLLEDLLGISSQKGFWRNSKRKTSTPRKFPAF